MAMLKSFFEKYSKATEKYASVRVCEDEKQSPEEEKLQSLLDLCEKDGEVYVVVVGLEHYFGAEPFERNKRVHLIKDPSNPYDQYAIKAVCDGFGKCGYVANSPHTVRECSISAEMIYDGFEDSCVADIVWFDDKYAICRLSLTCRELVFKTAVRFLAENRTEEALMLFLKLNEADKQVRLFHRICDCCYRLGDLECAKKHLAEALEIEPENPHSLGIKKVIEEKLTNISSEKL